MLTNCTTTSSLVQATTMKLLRWRASDFTIIRLLFKTCCNSQVLPSIAAKLGMRILHGECYLHTKPGYSAATNKQTAVVKIKNIFDTSQVVCIHAMPAIPS